MVSGVWMSPRTPSTGCFWPTYSGRTLVEGTERWGEMLPGASEVVMNTDCSWCLPPLDFLPTPKGGGFQPAARPVGALPLAGALVPASQTAQRRGLHRPAPQALRRDRC